MNIKSLSEKLKSLPLGAVLEASGDANVYVVGGPIRDFLLKRDFKDIDLAVEGDASGVARKFAFEVRGKFVELDARFDEWRVILEDYSYDFSGFPEGGLHEDLQKRDFTINSMAIDLRELLKGKGELIDPFGGVSDLEKKILRATTERAFAEDALRILRAFRFAAQLGFDIEEETLAIAGEDRNLLQKIAPERISYEITLIFSQSNSYPLVELMANTSVLCTIFPQLEGTKGVAQNKLHPLDVFKHSLKTYEEMENVINDIPSTPFADFSGLVDEYLSSAPRKVPLLKMACVLHDIAKPDTLQPGGDDRLHFYGHDRVGAEKIEEFAMNSLRMSKKDGKTLFALMKNHMWPHLLAGQDEITERAMRKFFRELDDEAVGVLLLAWADSLASVGPEATPKGLSESIKDLLHFYTEKREEVILPPLITGKDLIDKLGLSPSPLFGKILREIERQRDEGKVETKRDAIDVAKRMVEEG